MTSTVEQPTGQPVRVETGLPDVGGADARAVAAHRAQAPTPESIATVSARDVASNQRRGGDVRTVLAPSTCGSTTGFMGTVTLAPGEFVTEHWHPYSEEFLIVTTGTLTVRLDGVSRTLVEQEGVCVPIGTRHRLSNDTDATTSAVFTIAPLAPQPRLGHVDTEALPGSPSTSTAPADAGTAATGAAA